MDAPTDVLATAPTERAPVLVEIGKDMDPAAVTRGLDARALDALHVALRRCRCVHCLQLRGGAS